MKTQPPIDFCPAAACAGDIVRKERLLADVTHRMKIAHIESETLKAHLQAVYDEVLVAADEARARLSVTNPVSAAGAIAQLLAAIRDIRVRDDMEGLRARDLEERAIRFLVAAGLSDANACLSLSQSRLDQRLEGFSPANGTPRSN